LKVRIKARRIIAAGRINRAKMVENMANLLILLWPIKYHRPGRLAIIFCLMSLIFSIRAVTLQPGT